jgi:diguanylate cyclase (GGDEF)-like protein
MSSVMREEDVIARYGGDEFAAVAPNTTSTAAMHLAERLRAAAREYGISLSIGIAALPEDATDADGLLRAADAALYAAKQAGRDCVRRAA